MFYLFTDDNNSTEPPEPLPVTTNLQSTSTTGSLWFTIDNEKWSEYLFVYHFQRLLNSSMCMHTYVMSITIILDKMHSSV